MRNIVERDLGIRITARDVIAAVVLVLMAWAFVTWTLSALAVQG